MVDTQWQYDEMNHAGVNYANILKARNYEAKMYRARNIAKENSEILRFLQPTDGHIIVDIGAGTGVFSLEVAKHCAKVFAVDVSLDMLEIARKKAAEQNLRNIEFHNAGFLTYEYNGGAVDAVVSQFALHHLPDFWKSIALGRIYQMLKENGKFYLRDAVYSFDPLNQKMFFNQLIEKISTLGDVEDVEDIISSVSKEYSTLAWIMEGLILRAGFTIKKTSYTDGIFASYLCTKDH